MTKRTNYKQLIKALAHLKGCKVHSWEGIGLDYKVAHLQNASWLGVSTYGGKDYKDIYCQMLKNLNNYKTLAR